MQLQLTRHFSYNIIGFYISHSERKFLNIFSVDVCTGDTGSSLSNLTMFAAVVMFVYQNSLKKKQIDYEYIRINLSLNFVFSKRNQISPRMAAKIKKQKMFC